MPEEQTYRVLLQPTGVTLNARPGAPLRELLFEQGVEFPCGGQGRCRGCRCRVVEGEIAVTDSMRERLTPDEIAQGWRLACQSAVNGDTVIELRQWDVSVLVDESTFAFTPGEGLGVAVDLGTTTLVAQLIDLATGRVLGVRTALNPQAHHGGDVMSRVEFSITEHGEEHLRQLIRAEIGKLVRQALKAADAGSDLRRVAIVGNTVMHHLFSGVSVEPLSHTPFEPLDPGPQVFSATDLGWSLDSNPTVQFLPCLGGFVGSDILAGILATNLHRSERLVALVDLGTNGEIVLGNRERILCASTAAGPAFEGAKIHAGMRAATGAIWKVTPNGTSLHCEVLGGGEPRGLCGSGLVDAVAAGLDLGRVLPNGRLADGAQVMPLMGEVALTGRDIRELQLAKGAIAAGIRLLLNKWGARPEEVNTVYLAGAFGNYVNRASARRIGLINFPPEAVTPSGNTALLGAKMALFLPDEGTGLWRELERRMEHVALNLEPDFQDVYAEEMGFPRSA